MLDDEPISPQPVACPGARVPRLPAERAHVRPDRSADDAPRAVRMEGARIAAAGVGRGVLRWGGRAWSEERAAAPGRVRPPQGTLSGFR